MGIAGEFTQDAPGFPVARRRVSRERVGGREAGCMSSWVRVCGVLSTARRRPGRRVHSSLCRPERSCPIPAGVTLAAGSVPRLCREPPRQGTWYPQQSTVGVGDGLQLHVMATVFARIVRLVGGRSIPGSRPGSRNRDRVVSAAVALSSRAPHERPGQSGTQLGRISSK